MGFEWDENKNRLNISKHGYDFHDVVKVFAQPDIYIYPTLYHNEERHIAIGGYEGKHVCIVYPFREDNIRTISCRRARKKEIEIYEQAKRKNRPLHS